MNESVAVSPVSSQKVVLDQIDVLLVEDRWNNRYGIAPASQGVLDYLIDPERRKARPEMIKDMTVLSYLIGERSETPVFEVDQSKTLHKLDTSRFSMRHLDDDSKDTSGCATSRNAFRLT